MSLTPTLDAINNEVKRLTEARKADVEMGHQLIRMMQAAYAAGLRDEDEFAPGDEIEVTELEHGPYYYRNLGPLPAVAGIYGDDTTITVERGAMQPSGNEVFRFLAYNGQRYGYTIASRQLFERAGIPVIPIVCEDSLRSMLEGAPDMAKLTHAEALL
jgi:hypothetical protein